MENKEWDVERLRLEQAVQDAAEALFKFSGAAQVFWEAPCVSLPGDVSITLKRF